LTKQPILKSFLSILVCSLLFFSCKKKEAESPPTSPENGTYFSIRQFAKDQLNSFWEQPFSFEKRETVDGKTDTVLLAGLSMDWGAIFQTFFDADISDKKMIGKYNFEVIKEDATDSKIYDYEAKDPKLFTQKLQIVIDPFTDRIKAIFIETHIDDFWNKKSQKLFYVPLKVIQIQQFESPLIGKDKNYRVEYHFMN
jgi:hypothetical protein